MGSGRSGGSSHDNVLDYCFGYWFAGKHPERAATVHKLVKFFGSLAQSFSFVGRIPVGNKFMGWHTFAFQYNKGSGLPGKVQFHSFVGGDKPQLFIKLDGFGALLIGSEL